MNQLNIHILCSIFSSDNLQSLATVSTRISLLRDFPRSRACDATDKRTIILRRCLESSPLPRDNVHNCPFPTLPPNLFRAENFPLANSHAHDSPTEFSKDQAALSIVSFLPSLPLSFSSSPPLPRVLLSSAFYLASLLFPAEFGRNPCGFDSNLDPANPCYSAL